MSVAEVIDDDRPVAEWRQSGMVFRPGTTFEQWQEKWYEIDAVDKSIQWVIGDTLNTGEDRFPDQWSQVLDEAYAEKHRNNMWMSRKFPEAERRDGYSWSFHREIAALDKPDRDRWFDRAAREGWKTVKRLKEAIAAERVPRTPEPPRNSVEPPPPMSEADYGMEAVPQLTEPQEPIPAIPSGNRAETIRQLIDDVRVYGSWESDTALLLEDRIAEVMGDMGFGSLTTIEDALALKPTGWRVTIIEKDDSMWEVRLRAAGQKQAIALSAYLPNAVVEACLSAELSSSA